MARLNTDLRFGTSISRLWCETCKAETLHHKNRCGCGSYYVPEVRADKPPPFLAGANARALTRRKKA